MDKSTNLREKLSEIGRSKYWAEGAPESVIVPTTLGLVGTVLEPWTFPFIVSPLLASGVYSAYKTLKVRSMVEQLKKQGYTPEQAFKNAVKTVGNISNELDELKTGLKFDITKLTPKEREKLAEWLRGAIGDNKFAIKELDAIIG